MRNLKIVNLNGNRFQCTYLWKLMKSLKKSGVNVSKGTHFYRSNVDGIECVKTQESSDKSDSLKQLDGNRNIFSVNAEETNKVLKDLFADLNSIRNKLIKTDENKELLQRTLDKISSKLDVGNQLSNSSTEQLENILKVFSASLNFTNKYQNISDTKLLQALQQISINLSDSINKTSKNNDFEQLQHYLDTFGKSLNSTINAFNSSIYHYAEQEKKFENALINKLNEKHEVLSGVAQNDVMRMKEMVQNVNVLTKNISSLPLTSTKPAEQNNAYYPLQTFILLALLGVNAFMFYFLYKQIRITKKGSNNASVTEMENIISE